ncbi:alpha-2-macroglobulin, partial [Chitinimonas sp.]|uniref:alpha-2-macroglobulin family protein n=1 Tax=Chitinimonas sp. TaxID=1934313 RepID=UPI0035B496BF
EGIVMVEGDQLLWMKRVSIDSDKQQIDIPLDPSWKRHDLYVSVTVLRPGNQGDRVTPTRALGLIHLGIDRSNRRLPVKLAAPDKIRPDTTVPVKIAIAPASAKEAMVTVSAVDEGILNITEFKTPDPFQAFFGRLRYSGELRDLYGRLIEKLDGKKGKLRFGGDNSLKQPPKTPQKIKLVDLFNGPVHFNAQGEATVQVKVPDFNGRLRLMAVVAAPEQFGSAERSMVVAAPLIAEMNLPRFIASGDSAALALDLHNLSGNAQNLSVEVEAAAGLSLTGGKQSASLKDKEKTTLRLGVSAVGEPGLKTFTVKVAGNGINLKREFVLEVAAPTPAQQVSSLYLLAPGETVTLKNSDSAAWYPGRSSQLMLSALPPLNAQKVLQGLLQYPYGCAEQTTSSSYPWVFVDEEAAKRFGLPAHSREHRAEVLDKSFAKLGAYQAANGGFSLWGDGSAHDYWLSAYVTRFLQDARGEGFSVPQAMYDKALDYLQEQLAPGIASLPAKGSGWNGANGWSGYWEGRNRNFDVLAYGALVLAQERKVQLSTLRQLFELRSNANSGLALI